VKVFRYEVEAWPSEKGLIRRTDLRRLIPGVDALFISINDNIDREILVSAGSPPSDVFTY
jgi:hypothetical protein